MTGPAAHVTHFATPCDISGKAIEQVAVEGLVLKLVENSAGVLIREPIIACTNRLCDVVVHRVLPRWCQNTRVPSVRPSWARSRIRRSCLEPAHHFPSPGKIQTTLRGNRSDVRARRP